MEAHEQTAQELIDECNQSTNWEYFFFPEFDLGENPFQEFDIGL